jgi:hypothetical protein
VGLSATVKVDTRDQHGARLADQQDAPAQSDVERVATRAQAAN